MSHHFLTEEEKVEILRKQAQLGNQWTKIGRMLNIPEGTVRSFYKSYQRHHKLFPKRGQNCIIDEEIKSGIIDYVLADPQMTLRDLSSIFGVSPASAKMILNQEGIQYTGGDVCVQLGR